MIAVFVYEEKDKMFLANFTYHYSAANKVFYNAYLIFIFHPVVFCLHYNKIIKIRYFTR